MALGFARKLVADSSVTFESAGLDAAEGVHPTGDAIRAMGELGVDIRDHRSRSVQSLPLDRFTHVVAMTPSIADWLSRNLSIPRTAITVWNIHDPYGMGLEQYRECAKEISRALSQFISSALEEIQATASPHQQTKA